MKRSIACILCLLLLLSFCGCAEYEQLAQNIEEAAAAVNEAHEEGALAEAPAQITASAAPATQNESETPKPQKSEAPKPTESAQIEAAEKTPAATQPPKTAEPVKTAAPVEKLAPIDVVLNELAAVSAIPRSSHNETALSEYLYQWGLSHELKAAKDEAGNVIIEVPASTGCKKAPLTILQAHMNMLSIDEEAKKPDALKDGIEIVNDGRTLRANGASLGADGGIGVATALYLLSSEEPVYGPLRAIFTVNGEDGMTGAESLNAQHLSDAEYLINLDWENAGSVNNSSAGSAVYRFSATPAWKAPEGNTAYELDISKLNGGDSGECINMGRANAIKLLAGVLEAAYKEGLMPEIAAFSGGSASNAIAQEAKLTLVIHDADAEAFENVVTAQVEAFNERYGKIEEQAVFTCTKLGSLPSQVLYIPIGRSFCDMLYLCPDGINTMSAYGSGIVESSSNIGLLTLSENELWFEVHTRSSVQIIAEEQKEKLQMLSSICGCTMRQMSSSPGWAANADNKLVALICSAYKRQTGSEMKIEPVHAGSECGYFMAKNPELSCAAVGPTIENARTVNEKVYIDTIDANIKLLEGTLELISAQ